MYFVNFNAILLIYWDTRACILDLIQEVLLNTYVLFISETVTLPKDEVAFMQQWMLQQQKQHEETLVSVYLHFAIFKHFMFCCCSCQTFSVKPSFS